MTAQKRRKRRRKRRLRIGRLLLLLGGCIAIVLLTIGACFLLFPREEENTDVSILDMPLPEFFEKEGLDIKLDYKIKDKYIFENERFKEAQS